MPPTIRWNAEVLLEEGGLSVFVNRWGILARAKQPYVDWVNSMDDDGLTMDLESQRMQPTIFLINEREGMTLDEIVREFFWEAIFDMELVAWMRDTSVWPANRTVEMFYEWFEVELVADLIELGRGRIKSQ